MVRWFWFIVAVLFGAALGLIYGWAINPVEFVDTHPPRCVSITAPTTY
jgi:hypothetical protein